MILSKKNEDLNLVFNVRIDDFDYNLYVTSGALVCFGCEKVGHLVRTCAGKNVPANNLNSGGRRGKEAGNNRSQRFGEQ